MSWTLPKQTRFFRISWPCALIRKQYVHKLLELRRCNRKRPGLFSFLNWLGLAGGTLDRSPVNRLVVTHLSYLTVGIFMMKLDLVRSKRNILWLFASRKQTGFFKLCTSHCSAQIFSNDSVCRESSPRGDRSIAEVHILIHLENDRIVVFPFASNFHVFGW